MLDKHNTSENMFNSQGDNGIYFVYQEKISGKISPLSQQKLQQVNDLRFRFPFFKLQG